MQPEKNKGENQWLQIEYNRVARLKPYALTDL